MKSAFLLLLLCSLAHGASCPKGQAKDEATLVEIEQTWARAIEQHNMPALECILAHEFEEAGSAGELIDRAQMLASAATSGDVHYELSDMRVHLYGNFGYVRGVGVARDSDKPTVKHRFTDIFVYRDGRWQCVAGHQSSFPQGAP
jgi:ketosteroid isomerase-like protein